MREEGKTLAESAGEITRTVANCRFFARRGPAHQGQHPGPPTRGRS
jgi:acyl-CoA reductase-like NAD-dependent aldehyde dehydrogenase